MTRPKRFDTNLIVIGAGSAGLIASLIAATVVDSMPWVSKSPTLASRIRLRTSSLRRSLREGWGDGPSGPAGVLTVDCKITESCIMRAESVK